MVGGSHLGARRHPTSRETWVAAALALVFNACSGSERQIAGPGGGDDLPSTATLQVAVEVAPEDAELAGALGWEVGVPGADVHLLRNGSDTWRTAMTDAAGRAEFQNVLRGRYRLYAGRRLSSAEADAGGEPIRAFGDGMTFDVDDVGPIAVSLRLLADRPGDLVISELSSWRPPPWEVSGASTDGALYYEFYNNSDRVVYLDGKLFGQSLQGKEQVPTPCTMSAPARTDPAGLYARLILQFPGSGTEYPVLPGETTLVAAMAIDHSPVHPDLFDLRHADFEIGFPGFADNPDVPNMRDVGLSPVVVTIGGEPSLAFGMSNYAFFVAEPLDPHALPILFRDGNGRGLVRIPREALIDVATTATIFPDLDPDAFPCIPAVHPDFDRYEGGFRVRHLGEVGPPESFQRRILRTVGGRAILQNANTSAVDLMMAPVSPGALPPN